MLGFLVKTYPKISETFVLQEILELQKEAFGMNIFSMQRPTDEKFHKAFNLVTAEVNYLSSDDWQRRTVVNMHIKFISSRPWCYLQTLIFIFTRSEGGKFSQFLQAVYFSGLVQEKGIKHIHAHFASEPSGLAELVSRLCGISYSISAHAKDIYLQDKASLGRKIRHARFVVTCTDYNCRYLQSINESKTPVYRLYHGIDSARVTSENDQPLAQSAVLRILSVGRLREKKGFPTLLAACHLLHQSGYKFQCDIVGYGPDMENLQALIDGYHLTGYVRLLGKLTHEKLVALYRQTTIFALPCQIADDGDRDGIPNVLMEAMTFAIPVVSTNVSGIPELIKNNKTGFVIEAKNKHALFNVLKRLLDNPELCKQLGEAGKQYVTTQFSVDQHIGHLKELLTHTLEANGAANFRESVTGEQHG
jgi:glycosyltransferase involved in cell wall biosynthesis